MFRLSGFLREKKNKDEWYLDSRLAPSLKLKAARSYGNDDTGVAGKKTARGTQSVTG